LHYYAIDHADAPPPLLLYDQFFVGNFRVLLGNFFNDIK